MPETPVARAQPAEARPESEITTAAEPTLDFLDQVIEETGAAWTADDRALTKDWIAELVNQVLTGTVTVSKNVISAIEARIAEIDRLVSDQLNAVMHAAEFKRLEASWRGLHHLVHQSETGSMLKIRVINASKSELVNDFRRSPEFDQSQLFKKIYEDEYGTFGGVPYAALVGDYEFSSHPEDLFLLDEMSHVAAAAHAPFLSSASPEMFGLRSFADLSGPRDLAQMFDGRQYIKWRSFRDSEDSRYVALTLPRVLGRLPYGPDTLPVEAFDFKEDVDGRHHDKYLWMNAAYVLGARLTDAFAKYGWCAAIRGVEGGGLVEGLPTHTFATDDGEIVQKCPTEIPITDRREKELADLGFVPLVHCKDTDYAAFFGTQSAQKPKKYDSDAANANARLSAQLQYILAVSRVAHYLKAICRDKIGAFASRQNVEQYLNRWLTQYVLLDDTASQEQKAKKPLREARVEVAEVPGKPGAYKAVAFLRPHFQLDELTVSLRLVAELPQPTK